MFHIMLFLLLFSCANSQSTFGGHRAGCPPSKPRSSTACPAAATTCTYGQQTCNSKSFPVYVMLCGEDGVWYEFNAFTACFCRGR